MKKQMNIKKIDNELYLEECLYVIHEAFKKRDKELGFEPTGDTNLKYEELLEMYKKNKIYGYFINEKIVAFLSIDIRENEIKLKDIVVLPKYQKLGIGTKLIDYTKEIAKRNNKNKIILAFYYDNKKLMTWYEKNNFKLYKTYLYPNTDKEIGYMECIIK